MGQYVLQLQDIDRSQIAMVGGKAATLGDLSGIDGIRVPAGFCVTTEAFARLIARAPSLDDQLDQLSHLALSEYDRIRTASATIRQTIEEITIPAEITLEIKSAITKLGEHDPYAVRSSATAEDSPSASFAGQHDSYLDIRGPLAILHHVRRCWASLYTERAVTYRTRNGIDHRTVAMAVIVQRMISPNAAGILFTADPLTGNRTVASVEASPGLGEGLVSGLVNPDVYTVRDEVIAGRRIATTQLASRAGAPSDVQPLKTVAEQPTHGVLTDDDIVRLVQLGRRLEAHFGAPQDIEWCLVADDFYVVQSRPITTIFPVPLRDDSERHVYISVGHQQMMTDAMPPLGISLRQLTGGPPFHEAGGRVFVDVSQALASSAGRAGLLGMLGKSDPLIGDALETVIERGFIALLPEHSVAGPGSSKAPIPIDPAIVAELIGESERSVATLKRNMEGKSGMALLDFILADFQELKRILFDPRSHQAIMAGMEATWWLNEHLHAWLGEPNAADVLAQSVPNNVTSEMGLALLDVADVIRPHGEVVESLQRVEDERFLAELPRLSGGSEAREAINAWLEVYGMRGAGEIDITRPRWSERPSALVPLILANIKNFEPGVRKRRFERGQEEAQLQEDAILRRVRMLPDGDQKAEDVKQMIDRLRTFIGYREYPKYGMMSRYLVYKLALMSEAERLVAAGVLRAKEDVFYLTLPELRETVRTNHMDQSRIAQRKDAFKTHQLLTPPRVLTSEGEAINGSYRRHDVPSGALVGLAVSGGVAEGRARVILDMTTADLEVGDILVTTFTDPSWTPLFVAIKGLVTEVGGTMTHGSVIAREYGLPAVVSVEHATRRIRDGQQIRVHGTAGYVELL